MQGISMVFRALATAAASLVLVASALAQPAPPPEGEDNRYMYNRVQDGFLRLDTRTGQVSLCSRRAVGWACHAVPEERATLEGEISRLQSENALLKKEMLSRGLDLPTGMKVEPQARGSDHELRLPNAADVDRAMAFLERTWRRLVEVIGSLQKDVTK
jgi:hypothetical protein